MALKFCKKNIEDVEFSGFTDQEVSTLMDVFCRLMGKMEASLVRRAEFDLSDFASVKNSQLRSLKLVMTVTIYGKNKLWVGEFTDRQRNFSISRGKVG